MKTEEKRGQKRRHKRRKCALSDGESSPVGKARGAEITGSAMAQTRNELERERSVYLCSAYVRYVFI